MRGEATAASRSGCWWIRLGEEIDELPRGEDCHRSAAAWGDLSSALGAADFDVFCRHACRAARPALAPDGLQRFESSCPADGLECLVDRAGVDGEQYRYRLPVGGEEGLALAGERLADLPRVGAQVTNGDGLHALIIPSDV